MLSGDRQEQVIDSEGDEIRQAFVFEAQTLLEDLDDALLGLDREGGRGDLVDRVFRSLHTLKGSGAMAGFLHIARLAHRLEDVFQPVRDGSTEAPPELVDAFLQAKDVLEEMVAGRSDDANAASEQRLYAVLDDLALNGGAPAAERNDHPAAAMWTPPAASANPGMGMAADLTLLEEALVAAESGEAAPGWESWCAGQLETLIRGMEQSASPSGAETLRQVLAAARDRLAHPASGKSVEVLLKSCTWLAGLAAHSGSVETCPPPPELLEPQPTNLTPADSAGAGVPVSSASPRRSAAVNTARQCVDALGLLFRRLEQNNELRAADLQTCRRSLKAIASACARVELHDAAGIASSALQKIEALGATTLCASDEDAVWLKNQYEHLVESLARGGLIATVPGPAPGADREKTSSTERAIGHGMAGLSSVRVDQDKLDRLMRLAGELLVARGSLPSLVRRATSSGAEIAGELKATSANLSYLAEELQACVLAIRMLPLRTVFQRLPRLVRDLCRDLGKQSKLEIRGDDIEVDKSVIEKLGEPLVHLIRNSIDHGIETAEERSRAGKPAIGTIEIEARQQGSTVLIEISDDGCGLDLEKIKRKTVDSGRMTAQEASELSEAEIAQLIFAPGFSTASQVTAVSGRGVGLDVVRRSVEQLGGAIALSNRKALGLHFTVTLPRTLMVTKGLLATAAGQEFILPVDSVASLAKVPATRVHVWPGGRMTEIKGEIWRLVWPFGEPSMQDIGSGDLNIVLIRGSAGRCGVVVDRLISDLEIVLRPLEGITAGVPEYLGAAILADGRVVLVLNPAQIGRQNGVH